MGFCAWLAWLRAEKLRHTPEQHVLADVRRITGEPDHSTYVPADHRELCNRIFYTSYMGTENSSDETRQRAKDLAHDIGRWVLCLAI